MSSGWSPSEDLARPAPYCTHVQRVKILFLREGRGFESRRHLSTTPRFVHAESNDARSPIHASTRITGIVDDGTHSRTTWTVHACRRFASKRTRTQKACVFAASHRVHDRPSIGPTIAMWIDRGRKASRPRQARSGGPGSWRSIAIGGRLAEVNPPPLPCRSGQRVRSTRASSYA